MKKQIIISITGMLFGARGEAEWAAMIPEEGRLALPHFFVGRDGCVTKVKEQDEATEWLGERDESRVHVALCNVGALRRRGDKFYAASGEEVELFYEFCSQSPYRGHVYYEMITPKQISGLRDLLRLLVSEHGIRYVYDYSLGAVSPRCLSGTPGVYLASGLLSGRCDPHPQIELIKMLQKL